MTKMLWTAIPSLFLSMAPLGACAVDDPTAVAPDASDAPDPDVASVPVASVRDVAVTERSATTFSVVLSAPPGAATEILLTASDDARLALDPGRLTFRDLDWEVPQLVTVTALHDDDAVDDVLRVNVSAGGVAAATEVRVTVADDDILGIEAMPSSTLQVDERAATMIEVRLTARPEAAVRVQGGLDDSRVASISPETLSFTPEDWRVAQRIEVTGVVDADTTTETTRLRLKALGLAPVVIGLEVVDRVALAISPSTTDLGALDEGATGSFEVVLTTPPVTDLVVEVGSTDPDAVAVSPASLSFSSTTWSVPQTVSVAAPHDADRDDEALELALKAVGLEPRTVAVQVTDDDVSASR